MLPATTDHEKYHINTAVKPHTKLLIHQKDHTELVNLAGSKRFAKHRMNCSKCKKK